MPRSNMSAVYQVVISFVLLVTVAAYTANLAAFLTVSAVPVESAKDVCTQRQNPAAPHTSTHTAHGNSPE